MNIDGIDSRILQKLATENIREPTEIQQLVIPLLLQKQNVIFSSQTGTGKTYAYLLPAIENAASGGHCLIIAPTLELCVQIKNKVDFLLPSLDGEHQIKSALLIGSGNIIHQISAIKEGAQIIVGNTKRILQLSIQRKLNLKKINYIVLDEADRLVSSELYDETKEIIKKISISQKLQNQSIANIACSATLNEKSIAAIKEVFAQRTESNAEFKIVRSGKNEILQQYITHIAIWCEERDKIATLRSLLVALKPRRALIFATRSEEVQNIVAKLQYKTHSSGGRTIIGKNVAGLYSGMDRRDRRDVMEAFKVGDVTVLVSSDLAARGLDISGIHYIIETSVSENIDVYIHRAGRTARAGKKGTMISIGSEIDMRRLQSIERKLQITVYPKVLYGGRLLSPDDEVFRADD
ncbi:MAG: DEAD/DEAH box helicase [Termitinemataceae bacterium]|nr:MAG: DEAD/DEAH box helicase [Termitinemataceae bacterium]